MVIFMGMRIHKTIGYLINSELLSQIVVDNYADILENLDYEDEAEQQFFDNLLGSMHDYDTDKGNSEKILTKIMGNHFQDEIKKNNIKSYNLVSTLYMGDDDCGILICTPELFKACRYDDLIDYYENETAAHDINYLNRPIYPCQGYIYKGGLEEKHPDLIMGHVYDNYLIKHQYLEGMANSNTAQEEGKNMVEGGFFSPNVEAQAYLIAKASGILKPNVTEHEFNIVAQPMIATYWG